MNKNNIQYKTREEWQKLVNDFMLQHQSFKAYCKLKDIKYGTFKTWYYKLKSSNTFSGVGGSKANYALDAKSEFANEASGIHSMCCNDNKGFVGFRLTTNATTVKLPNGINIEVITDNVIELVQKLMNVA